MQLVVDLHIHSKYSRATSRNADLSGLYLWGKLKGITIIGTGDFTHPAWMAELQAKLEPAESGLYKLRAEFAIPLDLQLPESVRGNTIRFVPTVEISAIYRKGASVRKIHQLVVMPSLESAQAFNAKLSSIGNLQADGRPILGVDSKELLRLSLECESESLFIPAHIWTPWFGLFGSKSGFDSLEEAYEELTPHIHAIETGLSSDPAMNARLSQLKNVAITSHSDAHSPQKLGREATVVNASLSYRDIIGAFKTNDSRLVGTIEFFPEEGKYHSDGHRTCDVRFTPVETKAHDGACPKCHKALVVGVNYRVDELADLPLPTTTVKQVEYIVPFIEILAELRGVKTTTGKAVTQEYHRLIAELGDEFSILRSVPIVDIAKVSPAAALAIERMRTGQVHRDPGFDGVFGTISMFKTPEERHLALEQLAI